ncbi:hypothetical protein M0R45_004594 [Rubus argutus]|uniref:Protein kinase domain-containing protein n=1 Tax=Rubus argutus TaxID=59490 RepID=A0AAW1YKB3_RUBAR
METFHKCRTHVPIFSLLAFLLHFSSHHFLSFADDYFINCGSDANVSLTTGHKARKFAGDSNSGVTDMNQLPATVSSLYQTARASSQPFYYQFKITKNGTYLVRLHFLAFSSSSYNLSTAVFDVSDSQKFTLLSNFTAKSSTNSPIIKEFFLRIDTTGSFRLFFTPRASTLAFVNAIEFILVPSDFTPENSTINLPLNTIYRVNVGGPSLNDTIGRIWETDDSYMPEPKSARFLPDPNSAFKRHKGTFNKNGGLVDFGEPKLTQDNDSNRETDDSYPSDPNSAVKKKTNTLNENYYGEVDGLVVSNNSVAPEWVYQTAKAMNITTSRPAKSSHIMWSFSVSRNARHIVRAHFCDIIGAAPGNVVFNLYSNGYFRKEIGSSDNPISGHPGLPFYYDFMVNSSESEFIKISIRPNMTHATDPNAFLNGLEILEIMEGSASIPNVKESKKNNVALVVGSVVGGLSLMCLLIAGFVFGLRHRKAEKCVELSDWSPMPANGGGSSHSRVIERTITNLGLKISFAEIKFATNNFDTKLLIGKGGFGNVYRGTLLNGTRVAVKRAYKRDEHGSGSGQGLPEFQTEIMVLSKIHHRHLVSLIGYCDERSEMILVYEFMEKGTLRDHLYGSNLPPLSWNQRLEICTGAARGLQYLHTGAAGAIIHRDVKSTNILLDENYVAKVADFGLSRSGHVDGTHVSTNVKGTFGYLDPEYMMSKKLTEKSDVYSFGVVLLEVLCGRPAIDPILPREQINLAEWGMLCKKKGFLQLIVDSPLKGQIDPNSLRKFGETAEKCVQEEPSDRPTMGDVLLDLEYTIQLQKTARLEAHEDNQ